MRVILILAAMASLCAAQTRINWNQIANSPSTDNSRPLGDATHRFSNIYTFNLYSSGQVNLSGGGSFTVPSAAGLTPTASGQIGYDSTANIIRGGFNGASRIVLSLTGSPADNDCMKWTAATMSITTAGAPCGTGAGGGGGFNLITTGTNTTATMTVGTGASLTFTGTGIVNASQLNGGAFTGTNGDLVSFGAANVPADSAIPVATVVRNNQANTWTAGLQSLSAADLVMPTHAADPATCTAGQIEFNSAGSTGKLCLTTNTWSTIVTGTTGTGNAAANVTTTFSATPTFTCPSSTGGTIVNFALSTALTANITSSTLATCTAGSLLNFLFTQDPTGGRTVVMPASFDPVTIHPAANIITKVSYFLDAGGAGRLLGVVSNAGYGAGNTIAAPGVAAPTSQCFTWFDSTANVPAWKCNGATTASNSAQTIASGQTAMPTAAVAANTCSAAATTATATGTAATDAVIVTYAADPTGLTGYGGGTAGGITIRAWPTANTVNFKLCNETSASISPAALNINWRVGR